MFVVFVLPNLVFASWWNPFTWSWFNKALKENTILVATSTVPIIATTTFTTTQTTISEKNINTSVVKTIKTPEPTPILTTTSATQNCVSIIDQIQKDACYVALIKIQKDPAICTNIIDATKKDSCYIYLAYLKKDLTLCDFVIEKKSTCLSLVPDKLMSERSLLIARFMKNPTLENFKSFCSEAKNITGSKVEKTMDSSREGLTTKSLSFYYDIRDCLSLDASNGIYYLSLDTSLLIPLNSVDSDSEREVKLLYNEKVNSLISTSAIRFVVFNGQESISTPRELWNYYVSLVNEDGSISDEKTRNIQSFPDVISDLNRTFNTLKSKYGN
ncbi:MAG: hypothetical protein WCP24_00495 [bacterium]